MFMVWPQATVVYAFRESTTPGQVIVMLLFAGSIWAWTVMLTKYIELRRAEGASRRFLTAYRKQPDPLNLFLRRQAFKVSPLYRVYEQGCMALSSQLDLGHSGSDEELFVGKIDQSAPQLGRQQLDSVRAACERSVSDQALLVESNMGFLATAVSASPFLGLLGTVWGVMDAFGGMAVTGAATLSAVAPGISAALLTTVVGLLVALPSVIGYNLLTSRIRKIAVDLDNFAQEFGNGIQQAFGGE